MYEGCLCVCCMSTDDLVDLFEVRNVNGFEESYAKLLFSCLNIKMSLLEDHDSICTACVSTLKECVAFKRKVLKSISVISSVDLSTIVTEDDMALLGLIKHEKSDIHRKSSDSLENHFIEENDSDFSVEVLEDFSSPSLSPKSPPKEKVISKRPKGRPRKYPRDKIPYKIMKDETKCRECGMEFLNYISLKNHYNIHFPNHKCTVCKKVFMTRECFRKHVNTHNSGPFTCKICDKQFLSINTLQSHKSYKHNNVVRPPSHTRTRVSCPHCPKQFAWPADRKRHIENLHENRRHPCPECGALFKKSSIRNHLLQQHKLGSGFRCVVCEAVKTTRHALLRHMDSHFDTRRFTCKLCNSAFIQKVTLKYHIGSHIRRGEYRGDPNFLIIDTSDRGRNRKYGILSEEESPHCPDKILSSDTDLDQERKSLISMQENRTDRTEEIGKNNPKKEKIGPNIHNGNKVEQENQSETKLNNFSSIYKTDGGQKSVKIDKEINVLSDIVYIRQNNYSDKSELRQNNFSLGNVGQNNISDKSHLGQSNFSDGKGQNNFGESNSGQNKYDVDESNYGDENDVDKNNFTDLGQIHYERSDDIQIDSDLIRCISDNDINFSDLDV